MNISYSTFEYKNGWYGKISDPLSDNNIIIVHICSGNSELIPDECQKALEWFGENYEAMQNELLHRILEYYSEERISLGYDEEDNDEYSTVKTTDEISEMVTIRAITVPNQKRFKNGIFLAYDCSWDTEEGLGIRIVDGKITEIGNQGIAL